MPYEVRLSHLSNIASREEFEAAVAAHAANLLAFNKTVNQPRPTAHPLVEACVKCISYPVISKRPDNFEPDYVIIDDLPKDDNEN